MPQPRYSIGILEFIVRFFQVLYRSLVIRRAFHIHDVFACHVHIHIFICLYVRTYVCVSLVCVSVVLLCESLWSKIHFAWMCAYASVCKHFCLTVDNVEKHDGIYMYGFVWIYIQEHFWGVPLKQRYKNLRSRATKAKKETYNCGCPSTVYRWSLQFGDCQNISRLNWGLRSPVSAQLTRHFKLSCRHSGAVLRSLCASIFFGKVTLQRRKIPPSFSRNIYPVGR